MPYLGVIIHHSVCPSINGKGYDFYIDSHSNITPASEPSDPEYIHICIEGDFESFSPVLSPEAREQLFVLNKLLMSLFLRFQLTIDDVFPHTFTCPGKYFPWTELVISIQDRYH